MTQHTRRYVRYRIVASNRRADAPEIRNDNGLSITGICLADDDPLAHALKQIPYLRYYDAYRISVNRGFHIECVNIAHRSRADIREQARKDRERYGSLNDTLDNYLI